MQIIFEFPSVYGTFRDAINLPDDHGLSEAELTAMKQARLDNWVAHVEVALQESAQEA